MNNLEIQQEENFEEAKRHRYLELLMELGEQIHFEDDIWVCDKRIRSSSETASNYSIYFTRIPMEYKEIIKYYVIVRIMNGISIGSVKGHITNYAVFTRFLLTESSVADISKITMTIALQFRDYLDQTDYAEMTKNGIWGSISSLYQIMADFNKIKLKNYFSSNPYLSHERQDYKYISESVMKQLDQTFTDERIALELRSIYWVLRFIPSRIGEVLGMKLDCLKPYQGNYVIFIPTWKQNGGNKEPIIRSVHIKDAEEGAFLINILKQQQVEARKMQDKMREEEKGFLFTYQRKINRKSGVVTLSKEFRIMRWPGLSSHLKRICEEYNIRNDDGTRYRFTTHQLRHNGITDRLLSGFTIEQIAEMTAHHGDAMIYGSYTHFDLQPAEITKRQKFALNEGAEANEGTLVLFGGRILNMEEQLEKRLLKNIRAHRVRGGICSDVSDCKSDMWNCLECKHFIPDSEQLDYFYEQAESWRTKAIRFKDLPMIYQNALKNAELFQKIIDKIRLECKADEQQITQGIAGETGKNQAGND